MGSKYLVRTSERRKYPMEELEYTDYRFNRFSFLIKLLLTKRGKILFVTKWFR